MKKNKLSIKNRWWENVWKEIIWESALLKGETWWLNKAFCGIAMLPEKDDILEFNQYMKSDKIPYIKYADLESII